ncbi:MAG: type II secretion system F family protein [Acidaminobacteraceae bacterium]
MNSALLISIIVFLFITMIMFSFIFRKKVKNPKERLDIDEYDYDIGENVKLRAKFRSKIKRNRNKREFTEKISKSQELINKSDVNIEVEELIIAKLIIITIMLALSAGIIKVMTLSSSSILLSLILLVIGIKTPSIYLKRKIKIRNKLFASQLGDSISIFSNSIKAGYSFLQAVGSVSREMPYPVSKEFGLLLKEMSFGIDSNLALQNMTKRIDSEDLELMITAILIQRETGGNLSEILDNISETIRERITIQGEVKTLTAQGKMSGIIVGVMPLVLGLILYFANKEYMMVLFTTTPGRIALGVAFVNEVIGVFLISKIIKIDF